MSRDTMRFVGQWVMADFKLTRGPFSRLGLTVSRRYGPSYKRNRFKRLVKESFRLSYPKFPLYFDLLVRPRSQALDATLKNIDDELFSFIIKFCQCNQSASKT